MASPSRGPREVIAFVRRKVTPHRILIAVGQLWAVPLVVLIRLLRPLVLVRIGILYSEYFGHYAGNVELYLCERDAGINRPKRAHVDLWFNLTGVVSNEALQNMWKRQLVILPRVLLAPVYRLNKLLPFGEIHEIASTYHDRDVNGLLRTQLIHAVFTKEEEAVGRRLLAAMGIPEGARFVCLNVRDGAFHSQKQFTNYRNADVTRYMLAAEALTSRGFYVIRMGKKVERRLESKNDKILDYASSPFRSDFMDIYLGAHCFFALSTSSGWDSVPGMLFRRPVLHTNVVPISQVQSWGDRTLAIFKRHWFPVQSRFLTQSEIFYLIDRGFVSSFPSYDEMGVELVENTPEELRDAALEMTDMLSPGGAQPGDADDETQKAFWSLYTHNLRRFGLLHLHGELRVRIGRKFLKGAPELMSNVIDPAVARLRQESAGRSKRQLCHPENDTIDIQ